MSGKLFIEPREREGDYVIRRPGADRASGREIRKPKRSKEHG